MLRGGNRRARRDKIYQLSACNGKAALTNVQAREIVRDMRKRGRRGMHEYRCEFCRRWHIGGNGKWR